MPVSTSHRPNAPIDKLVTAYAINAPAALGEDLFVVVPSASGNRSHVVAWAPKTPLPVANDECLVAYDESGNPWVVAWIQDSRVAPSGPWQALTLGAKCEASPSFQEPGARLGVDAASVDLRGVVLVKVGEELKAGETLAKVPAGLHPNRAAGGVAVIGGVSTYFELTPVAGNLLIGASIKAGWGIVLDDVRYNLT